MSRGFAPKCWRTEMPVSHLRAKKQPRNKETQGRACRQFVGDPDWAERRLVDEWRRMKTTDLRIADVRVTENAGGLPSNVETRPLPEARWTARGGATPRLLRFCVKAPNTNSEIGTTRLARPRVRNKQRRLHDGFVHCRHSTDLGYLPHKHPSRASTKSSRRSALHG